MAVATESRDRAVPLREILFFFLPLMLTSMLMMTSHSIVTGGIARTIAPVASMAAYSVGSNIAFMGEGPSVMMRQMTLALIRGRKSFATAVRVGVVTLGLVLLVGFAIGYTALGRVVFTRLLGVPEELMLATLTVYRVTMFVAASSALRSFFQGTLILRRRTFLVTQAMIARISVMAVLVYCFNHYHWVQGSLVGAITILAGMSTEAIYNAVRGFRHVARLEDDFPGQDRAADFGQVVRFFYPLVLAALAASLARPVINAGLARTADPVVALAAFSVATSVGFIIVSPTQNVHQVVLVFLRGKESYAAVRRFVLGFGLCGFAALGLVAVTPFGAWLLRQVVGVDPSVVAPTLQSMRVFSLLPLVMSLGEFYTGLLLLRQQTRLISAAKAANLAVVVAVVLLLPRVFPAAGSSSGAIAMVSGTGAEAIMVYLASRRLVVASDLPAGGAG